MGRHTTPGGEAPAPRDDVIAWGAFSTVVAAVLVGLLAGWFEAFGVLVLGGLTTAALWFARAHGAGVLGRGRHASDTPWSPSDLLELKDAEPGDGTVGPTASPSSEASGPDGASSRDAARRDASRREPVRRETAGRRRPAEDGSRGRPAGGRRAAAPAADGGDPLGWLPATPGAPDVATAMASTPPGSRRRARAVAAAAVNDVDAQTAEDVLDLRAAERLDALADGGPAAAPGPDGGAPGTGEPPGGGRRTRRAVEEAGGPTRPVLPVAPFEMAGPGRTVATGGFVPPAPTPGFVPPAPTPGFVPPVAGPVAAPVAPVAAPVATPVPVVRVLPAAPPDPLAGPLDLDAVAAEPTVLDPALDPLWPAPVLELTQEQALPPDVASGPPVGAAAVPAAVPAPAPTGVAAAAQAAAAVAAVPPAPRPAPRVPTADADLLPGAAALRDLTHVGRQVRPVADRERAAASLDPLWARRARRPERPRSPGAPASPRPATARREPAPLDPLLHPTPTPVAGLPAQQAAQPTVPPTVQPGMPTTMPPQRTPAEPAGPYPGAPVGPNEPFMLVLPEPDVPDVLMLPEHDPAGRDTGPDAPGGAGAPVGGDPSVPAARPAPGTLSLDELLVLHTRRPLGRATGQDDTGGRGAGG